MAFINDVDRIFGEQLKDKFENIKIDLMHKSYGRKSF